MPETPKKPTSGESQKASPPPPPSRRPVVFRSRQTNDPPSLRPFSADLPPANDLPSSPSFAPPGTDATVTPNDSLARPAQDPSADAPAAGENEPARYLPRRTIYNRTADPAAKPKSAQSKIRGLLALLAEEAEGGEEDELLSAEDAQTAKVLQTKRFPRTGATPEGNPLAFRPRADRPPGGERLGSDPVGVFATAPHGRYSRLALLLAALCLAQGGLVFYLLSQLPAKGSQLDSAQRQGKKGAQADHTPLVVTDHALEVAGGALRALQAGEFEKAAGLYKQARAEKLVLPGLNYQAALLALGMGDVDTGVTLTDYCIENNEDRPTALYLRARVAASQGDYARAASSFGEAARATPFSARNFFFWAECLRRQGSPARALAQFDQALLRRPGAAETDLLHFKRHLTMIEAGGDDKFQAELASHLAVLNPSGDTLLVAAANELNRNAYPAAAEFLRRGLQTMPVHLLESRLSDSFFRLYLGRAEIAAVLHGLKPALPPASSQKPLLIDPATQSLADADPAGWL